MTELENKQKGEMEMKEKLRQYVDACELIGETEEQIRRSKKRRTVRDSVSGSNPEFPYQKQSFVVEGEAGGEQDEWNLMRKKAEAEDLKTEVEAWMDTIPLRMQRIIRLRLFEHLSWNDVAAELGRGATGDGIRMEYRRFFEKK